MKIQRKAVIHSEVSTGALTDIMFFLLLFFLIVSTVTNPNVIKLLLPGSSSSKGIAKESITISINKSLQYFIGEKPVKKEMLLPEIEAIAKTLHEPTIVLRVEQTVPIEYLVEILDIGLKKKIKVVLATQRKDG